MYIKNEVIVPLIYGQEVECVQKSSRYSTAKYEDVGKPFGPFLSGYGAGRAIGEKSIGHVNDVLNGLQKTVGQYRFYYEGEKKFVFKIPNMNLIKEKGLLKEARKLTLEMMIENFNTCGFKIINNGELKGNRTRFTVKCCNEQCENEVEKEYRAFISRELLPLCEECILVPLARNKTNVKKKSLADVRPDLVKYYHESDNNDLKMDEISYGASVKVMLRCDECGHEKKPKPAHKYGTIQTDGNLERAFSCDYCNSLGVKFPEIAAEWNYEKNEGTPFDFTYGNNKSFWWKCIIGHEWKARISSRTKNESGCPQCYLIENESEIGKLMKQVIKDLATIHTVDEETLVDGSRFRNDCVLIGTSGQRIVFELQGDYFHYGTDAVIRESSMTGEKYHKDNLKFANNRANGDLVILINEYDFSTNGTVPSYEMMKRAILQIMRFLAQRNFEIGSDIAYNKFKNEFSLKYVKSYYANSYNSTVTNEEQIPDDLTANTLKLVQFQLDWNVF